MENKNNLVILKQYASTLQGLAEIAMPNLKNAESYIKAEIINLHAIAEVKPEILECTQASILNAVKLSIMEGMSLNPNDGMVYLTTRYKPGGGKILEYNKTARGWVSFARQCGVLFDIKAPQVTFDKDGRLFEVKIEMLLNSYQEPRWETKNFGWYAFQKWMDASQKERSNKEKDFAKKALIKANQLYYSNNGQPDIDFICTKCIKHAVKALALNKQEVRKDVLQFIPEQIEDIIPADVAIQEAEEGELLL